MNEINNKNVCRTCLDNNPHLDLSNLNKELNVNYINIISYCTSVEVCVENSPKICQKCENLLVGFYKFKLNVIEIDRKFKEQLKIVPKLEPEIEIHEDENDDRNDEDFAPEKHTKSKNKKPCQCEVCGKVLSSKSNLQMHMKSHSGDKPFKCEYCSKTFTRAKHLAVHRRVHTGKHRYF